VRLVYIEDNPSKKIPAAIRSRLFRKLQLVDDATSSQDLRSPPSNHFEKLSGNLAGKHSIRVNDQWRLVFAWDDGHGEASGLGPRK
jgi:proteic killer suppression protein